MDRQAFLESVTKQIRTKEVKQCVSKELNHHIKMAMKDYINQGMTEEAAEQKALREMGNPDQLSKQFNQLYKRKIEWSVVALFLCSLTIGIIAMFVLRDIGDSESLIYSKMTGSVLAIIAFIALACMNYRKWHQYRWWLFGAGTLFLLLLHFESSTLVVMINGISSVRIPGLFTVDTSIVLILYMVTWAALLANKAIKAWLLLVFAITSSILLYTEADYIIFVIYMFMLAGMYAASKRTTAMRALGVIIGWLTLMAIATKKSLSAYQSFFSAQSEDVNFSYSKEQIAALLHETSWLPKLSITNRLNMVEYKTDYVFTGLTYTLGWGLSLALLALLILFIVKLATLAKKVPDLFGHLLIIGGVAIFTFQIGYNIAMSYGILPPASISLPFISYGTGSLLINAIIIGIIVSVYSRKDIPCNTDAPLHPLEKRA